MNSRCCIVHRDITLAERKKTEELLGLRCEPSTINMGSPHIRCGLICNDNGFIVGDSSGGPEIVNAEQELGFLEKKRTKVVK
jgi:translation initiation factor 6